MRLHNKFEVEYAGKKLIASNKMFSSIFDALADFGGYCQFVSIGNGNQSLGNVFLGSLSGQTMVESLGILSASELEFQFNPFVGPLYAKYKITIPAQNFSGKQITEIGFCVLPSELNNQTPTSGIVSVLNHTPSLYNYAYFVDENEQPTSITIENQDVVIFATIFLDWDVSSQIVPLGKNNDFLKFLMGSNVYNKTAPTFDFGIGQDHRPNNIQIEQDYSPSKKYTTLNVAPKITKSSSAIHFKFIGKNSNHPIPELSLLADEKVVIRQNREYMSTASEMEESVTVTPTGRAVLSRSYIDKVIEIRNETTGEVINLEEELAKYPITKFGCLYSEPFPKPFGDDCDYNISSSGGWRVFESKCGNMLAMVSENTIDIYASLNEDFLKYASENIKGLIDKFDNKLVDKNIIKLDSSQIMNISNITNLEFFNDHVFVLTNQEPYLEHYKYQNGELRKTNFNLNNALNLKFGQDYCFYNTQAQEISLGTNKQGNVVCAVKVSDDKPAVILELECNGADVEIKSVYMVDMSSTNNISTTLALDDTDGYVLISGSDSLSNSCLGTFSFAEGYKAITISTFITEFGSSITKKEVGRNYIRLERSAAPNHVMLYFPNNRRFFLYNNNIMKLYINKRGRYMSRHNISSNAINGIYLQENNILTAMGNQPKDSLYKEGLVDIKYIGDDIIFFKDTEPYTHYLTFGRVGYTIINGLNPGDDLTVKCTLLQAVADRSARSILLDVELSI